MATLQGKLQVLVFTDTTATNNPKSKIVDIDESLLDSSVTEFSSLIFQVPNLTVDQAVNLNGIEGEKMLILSDQPVSFKVNGSATGLLLSKLFLDGSNVTSLSVSNSSGQTANIRIALGK